MSGLNKDRFRNQTVCFRASPEERRTLEAKIKVAGVPKGEFILRALLEGKVEIAVGKYKSDRLSLELKRLRERLDDVETDNEETDEVLRDSKALLEQLLITVNEPRVESTEKKERSISIGKY